MGSKDKLRRLEHKLAAARSTILGLMPEPTQRILRSFRPQKTASEMLSWQQDILDEIIELDVKIERAAS